MGLLSYPRLKLEVLARGGTEDEKKYVHGILPLIQRHHLVLVSFVAAHSNDRLPFYWSLLDA